MSDLYGDVDAGNNTLYDSVDVNASYDQFAPSHYTSQYDEHNNNGNPTANAWDDPWYCITTYFNINLHFEFASL